MIHISLKNKKEKRIFFFFNNEVIQGFFFKILFFFLVFFTHIFFGISVSRFSTDFFVILFEGSEIFTGFREFTFFHTFTDVPVDEGTLGVHQVELVIDAGEDFGDGGGVGNHADGALDLGEVTAGDDGGRLVVDTALEAGGAPVDELDGALGLDGGDGGVDVLGDNITAEHEAAGHVLTVAGVALGEHGGGFEGGVGDFSNGELFVVGLFGGDDGSVGSQDEVDTGIGDQVGLEFGDVDVEGTVEAERGGEGGDDLTDQTVEVGVGGAFDVEVTTAKVIDSFVVEHGSNVGVFEESVGGEDGVVGFDDGGGDLGRRIDGVTELGLLAVVNREAFEEEGTETGTGTTTDGVEDKETLETGAVVSELADAVEAEVDDFLTDGVVTTGVVVGGVFLAGDELFGVEELAVSTGADFIDDGGFEVEHNTAGDMLAGAGFGEKSIVSIIFNPNSLVRGHGTVRLNTMFQTKKFPTGVTNLDTSLANVNRDDFTHGCLKVVFCFCYFLKEETLVFLLFYFLLLLFFRKSFYFLFFFEPILFLSKVFFFNFFFE